MSTARRTVLLWALVATPGCLSSPGDQEANEDADDDAETSDSTTMDSDDSRDSTGGNSDGTILVSGTVFTDDLGESVDAVPTDDERFDGSEPWQSAFETIERLVREDDPVLDEPDRTATLAVVERGTDQADTVVDTHETLPVSRPTGYPDGRYVEHVVDGEPTYAAIRLLYPEED